MRGPRKQCESEIYHVICRGVGKQLIFEDDSDRNRLLELLSKFAGIAPIEVMAWCFMGNHIHLLFYGCMEQISWLMRCVCGSYAQYFNARYGRSGHLFQERFKSEPVDGEPYLLSVVRYIHLNPEKAGIAAHDDYLWSSYGQYVGRSTLLSAVCSTGLVLELAGGRVGFVNFHRARPGEEPWMDVDALRSRTRAMTDEEALDIARDVLHGCSPGELKALGRWERNRLLGLLLAEGLSVRQIERLTGIGRGVIQRVKKVSEKQDGKGA